MSCVLISTGSLWWLRPGELNSSPSCFQCNVKNEMLLRNCNRTSAHWVNTRKYCNYHSEWYHPASKLHLFKRPDLFRAIISRNFSKEFPLRRNSLYSHKGRVIPALKDNFPNKIILVAKNRNFDYYNFDIHNLLF